MILLVEDNEDDVFIMRRLLKKIGCTRTLYNAVNGRDALNYLQGLEKYSDRETHPLPSLILLDLKLPFVHGFEVLEWAVQEPSLRHIPIVVLTSSPEQRDRDRAYQLGAKTFLIKPPSEEILRHILAQVGDIN